MKVPPQLESVLECTPDTLSGAVRFAGTRVFAYQLFDYLLTERTLEQFLEDFEGVSRQQAEALMAWQLDQVHHKFEPRQVA